MASDQSDKWRVEIESACTASGGEDLIYLIRKGACSASLEEGAKLTISQEDLICLFAEEVTHGDSFWEPLLQQALGAKSQTAHNHGVEFLGRLREALERGRPRDELARLSFQLVATEGRLAHTEQRIWQLLNDAIEMGGVEATSIGYEDKVLGIATTDDGRLKATVSDRIVEKMNEWLTRRGAVDRIRELFQQLPLIFRLDTARALLALAFFLGGVAVAGGSGGVVRGPAAVLATVLIVVFAAWTLLATVIARQGSGWAIALRPAFQLRWQGLFTMAWIAVSSGVVVRFTASATGAAAMVMLVFGAVSAGWLWHRFCGRFIKEAPGCPHATVVKRRMSMLLALNFEEAFAIGLIVDVLSPFVGAWITGERESAGGAITFLGLHFPQIVVFDLGVLSYQIRPACTLFLTGLTLLFCLLVALKRTRLPI